MNPLDQLQDIALPAQVGTFPWAWGWWLLLAVTLVAIGAAIYWLKQRRQQRHFATLASTQLTQLSSTAPQFSQQVSELLKQTFAAYGQRQQCAALAGEQWHQFLNEYHSADWLALLGNPYQPQATHGGESLRQAAQQVLKQIPKGVPDA
ncbi:DUF4381 domain-containing protein [Ferrimonas lipolytica]|uniref:DUF4381 domain-containing protein n=1 Tax=Ferrimonas lipolytica TaxID=2724191 RepID=A0A6H1UDP2_9GAMM|nr:DUF4381 domain-containing protein [Ferrimonas lipolytica]QIZ77227.1 DUF4381 domain-containing protein [Ferrimonas lipolytica]